MLISIEVWVTVLTCPLLTFILTNARILRTLHASFWITSSPITTLQRWYNAASSSRRATTVGEGWPSTSAARWSKFRMMTKWWSSWTAFTLSTTQSSLKRGPFSFLKYSRMASSLSNSKARPERSTSTLGCTASPSGSLPIAAPSKLTKFTKSQGGTWLLTPKMLRVSTRMFCSIYSQISCWMHAL